AATSTRPTMRSWSVLRWPVVLAAMSDSTRSALPPSISRSFAGAVSSRKSSCTKSTPGISPISRRSMATTLPLPSTAPTFAAALGADAGIVDALLVAHRQQPLHGARHVGVVHPEAIHMASVVARQVQIDAGHRGDGPGGAQQMHAAQIIAMLLRERRQHGGDL